MEIGRVIRRQAQCVLLPLLGVSLSGYFAYHLLTGDHGLYAWTRLNEEIRQAKQDAAHVHALREAEERRVAHLRTETIDPELLDEQAREHLNLVAPGEIVILNDAQNP
jgi:cell division protein FtsB